MMSIDRTQELIGGCDRRLRFRAVALTLRARVHCLRLRPIGHALRAPRQFIDGCALSGWHSLRSWAIHALRAYKLVISPWLPPACRFVPTCSEYATAAIERYGLLGGATRAVARVLRCHPLHRGGFDPLT